MGENKKFEYTDELIVELITTTWLAGAMKEGCRPYAIMQEFKEKVLAEQSKNECVFDEDKINKKLDELTSMEKEFNIAKEGKYKTFKEYQMAQKIAPLEREIFEKLASPASIPLDYEILEFRNINNDPFIRYVDGMYYYPTWHVRHTPGFDVKTCFEANLKIHSVKRLSDSEIFNIGDEVMSKHRSLGKIKEFTIDNGILLVHTDNDICDIEWLSKIEYWDKPVLSCLDVERIMLNVQGLMVTYPVESQLSIVSKQIRELAQQKINGK